MAIQRINVQRLRWLGHVVRIEEAAPGICESRRREQSCIRWKDQI